MNRKLQILIFLLLAVAGGVYGLTWSSLGPVQLIEAGDPAEAIVVEGYSIPSTADWNNDGLADLIVGEGSESTFLKKGLVRIYLNTGTSSEPAFADGFNYVQDGGARLEVPAGGCLGVFPRVVQWDGDGKKDLLLGLGDGSIRIYLNIGTDAAPVFNGWQVVEVGSAGSKTAINVGYRACPIVTDWNSDGKKDLVVGCYDGVVLVFINEGTDTAPDFITSFYVQEDGANLVVPELRSSPEVADLNGDGKKDLLVGDTEGYISLYVNVGTDESPVFSGYTHVEADGQVIDLPHDVPSLNARSRPFLCDWNDNGYWDILVGSNGYGNVYLYEGLVFAGDLEPDGDVDLTDFAAFASWWQDGDCGNKNDCGGADILGDGDVLMDDLAALVENWLAGKKI